MSWHNYERQRGGRRSYIWFREEVPSELIYVLRQILQATHWEEGQQTHTPEEACIEPLRGPNDKGPKGSSHATVGLDLVTCSDENKPCTFIERQLLLSFRTQKKSFLSPVLRNNCPNPRPLSHVPRLNLALCSETTAWMKFNRGAAAQRPNPLQELIRLAGRHPAQDLTL